MSAVVLAAALLGCGQPTDDTITMEAWCERARLAYDQPEVDVLDGDAEGAEEELRSWVTDLLADPLPEELREDADLLLGRTPPPDDVRAVDAILAAGNRIDALAQERCGIDTS